MTASDNRNTQHNLKEDLECQCIYKIFGFEKLEEVTLEGVGRRFEYFTDIVREDKEFSQEKKTDLFNKLRFAKLILESRFKVDIPDYSSRHICEKFMSARYNIKYAQDRHNKQLIDEKYNQMNRLNSEDTERMLEDFLNNIRVEANDSSNKTPIILAEPTDPSDLTTRIQSSLSEDDKVEDITQAYKQTEQSKSTTCDQRNPNHEKNGDNLQNHTQTEQSKPTTTSEEVTREQKDIKPKIKVEKGASSTSKSTRTKIGKIIGHSNKRGILEFKIEWEGC